MFGTAPTKIVLDLTKRNPILDPLVAKMNALLVGQPEASRVLVDMVSTHLSGFGAPGRPAGSALLLGPTGSGKCLAPGTVLLMHNGAVKRVEDLVIGDKLMGPDSTPRTVLSLTSGEDNMFTVCPKKGDPYTVNSEHILSLHIIHTKRSKSRTDNISIMDYLSRSTFYKHRAKGYRVSVDFKDKECLVDPYFLGLWLGDGNSYNTGITTADKVLVKFLKTFSKLQGLTLSVNYLKENAANTYTLTKGNASGLGRNKNPLLNYMNKLGVINNKHVPLLYKANTRDKRLALLAGYLDADGSYSNGCFEYTSVSKTLADDIAFVARSLGFACYVAPCKKQCQTGAIGNYYRGIISGELQQIPCKLSRKKAKVRKQIKNVLHTGLSVSPAGYGKYFGFTLDKDGLFLLADFTVTHNTHAVEVLCEGLVGDPRACIKIDCAEFQHSHEIAKLIGSPPGYLGHRETPPLLTQEALAKFHKDGMPLSVVLFDEIEKASDSLWQLLLGILDKATLTLGTNVVVNFEKVMVIMTSNLGAKQMHAKKYGFKSTEEIEIADDAKNAEIAKEAAKKHFTPEFINRLDHIVVFKTLTREQIAEVMQIELGLIQKMFYEKAKFVYQLTPAAKATILNEGYSIEYGARDVKRVIERRVRLPLSGLVASGQIAQGSAIVVDQIHPKDEKFEFSIQKLSETPVKFKDAEDIL